MATPDWFPDELAHAGDEHLDPVYVQGYDQKAGTDPTDDVTLLRELGLGETHTLVDLGTGTGTFALAAAPFCRRVVAVDVSQAMLTNLGEKADKLGIGNVECVRAGFLSYGHKGALADFVYTRNALHHLSDFWKALALERIAAMMRPGGVLRLRDIVYSFEPRETEQVIEAWMAGAAKTSDRGWTRAELAKDIREEHITFNWLLEPMIERAGFTIQEASDAGSRVFAAYTCRKTG